MTLPASGTITMTMVKNELGVAFPLNLAASNVRTLFVKPTGVIKLTDGYGKSNKVRWYPTGYTTTNAAILTTPGNMYNSEVTDATAFLASNQMNSGVFDNQDDSAGYELVFSFGALSGKVIKSVLAITLNISSVTYGDIYLYCGAGPYEMLQTQWGYARVDVSYTTNGSTWTALTGYQANQYQNQSFTKTLLSLTPSLTGSDVRIKFTVYGTTPQWIYDDPTCASLFAGIVDGKATLEIFGIIAE